MADTPRRGPRPTTANVRPRRRAFELGIVLVVAAISITACSDTSSPEPTAADYAAQLAEICAETAAQLDALPDPPDGITVTDFASQASSILTDEAERFRDLDVPADLDGDHRALIRNDEEQAAGWTDLASATASGSTELSEITTTIASLNLGRNDLVTELGAPGCVRSPG